MVDEQRISQVILYLPRHIGDIISRLISKTQIEIDEIRLRANCPLTISVFGESCFVTPTGGISNHESDAYRLSAQEVQTAFSAVCENSVYAHLEELRQGFITIKGGHRVGVCGKAVTEDGRIKTFKEISSLNFRIANQIIGIADGIIDSIIKGKGVTSTLIISPPGMGKTTLLRDIARQVSDRGFRCGIADDRGELAAMHLGVASNLVGAQTDIIDGAPKAEAIEMLLRTMSPEVIISDEIASDSDVAALRVASGTGVAIIATTHGAAIEEVMRRNVLLPLFKDKIFSQAVLLSRDFSTPESVTYTRVVEL